MIKRWSEWIFKEKSTSLFFFWLLSVGFSCKNLLLIYQKFPFCIIKLWMEIKSIWYFGSDTRLYSSFILQNCNSVCLHHFHLARLFGENCLHLSQICVHGAAEPRWGLLSEWSSIWNVNGTLLHWRSAIAPWRKHLTEICQHKLWSTAENTQSSGSKMWILLQNDFNSVWSFSPVRKLCYFWWFFSSSFIRLNLNPSRFLFAFPPFEEVDFSAVWWNATI